jgi:hypothetical protein
MLHRCAYIFEQLIFRTSQHSQHNLVDVTWAVKTGFRVKLGFCVGVVLGTLRQFEVPLTLAASDRRGRPAEHESGFPAPEQGPWNVQRLMIHVSSSRQVLSIRLKVTLCWKNLKHVYSAVALT